MASAPHAGQDATRARLLIVNDSVTEGSAIAQAVTALRQMDMAGSCRSLDAAVAFLQDQWASIILLDHDMVMTADRAVLKLFCEAPGRRGPVALIADRTVDRQAWERSTMTGCAADLFIRPARAPLDSRFFDQVAARLAELCVIPDTGAGVQDAETHSLRAAPGPCRLSCLAIGASTGGIMAINELCPDLGALGLPVLITQHLPAAFLPYFADQVRKATGLPTKLGEDGDAVRPGHVYIAPGSGNMVCRKDETGRVTLTILPERVSSQHPLPAVDPMFESVGRLFGPHAAAIILTGMGRDGAAGASVIAQAGGTVIAQSRQSSVVWGMPGQVVRGGWASAVLKPGEMIPYLKKIIRGVA